ncbi:MAG: biopolymer transporter ExbD [Pirellulaceae bacterium]
MPLPGKGGGLSRRRRVAEEAEMDITPMIDCTFLLLIFFIVTSKMNAETPIDLPIARHGGAVVIKESIIITVMKGEGDEALIYKGETATPENLIEGANLVAQEEALARYIEQQANSSPPKRNVLIKGSKGIKFKEIDRVARAAKRSEVEQLYVAVLETQ